MKTFKIADCIVQLLLIFGALFINLVLKPGTVDESFFMSYFLVGSWQIISLIVHLFFPGEYKVELRRLYSILLLLTAVVFLIGLFSSGLLINVLFGLLYWSPLLAILYLITCILEIKKLTTVVS